MQAEIKAARGASSVDRVRKLTLTASDPVDEAKLAILAWAIMPVGERDRDTAFDAWLLQRMDEYCRQRNLKITVKP